LDAHTADQEMIADFLRYTGQPALSPRHVISSEWRSAAAEKALEDGCLWDGTARIGICGDWCAGSRIEGAFLSGSAVAGRLLAAAPRMVSPEAAAR
jgi:hypothetical protein